MAVVVVMGYASKATVRRDDRDYVQRARTQAVPSFKVSRETRGASGSGGEGA